jgi:hypothetical protein
MTGDHHGQTAMKATPLVTATDEILGTHNAVMTGSIKAHRSSDKSLG